MREIVDAVDANVKRRGGVADEAPATARLSAELEHRIRDVVTDFIKVHESELDATSVCGALLGAAAVQMMTLFEMGPDDFAEIARATGRLSLPEVTALRARLRRTGIG
jgi:hypothetical protein